MHLLRNSIVIFLVGVFLNGNAQRMEQVGIDLTKMLPVQYNSGIVAEPFVIVALKDSSARVIATSGYVNIKVNRVYNNMTYFNKGFYFKVGMSKMLSNHWEMGANLVYSKFDELGKATLEGSYFGDWSVRLQQSQQLFGLEHHTDFWIPLSKHLSFDLQLRLALILNRPDEPDFGTYYAPGFGFVQVLKEDSRIKTSAHSLAGGLSIRLVYKL